MRLKNKIIFTLLMLLICSTSVFAEPVADANPASVSVGAENGHESIDNSVEEAIKNSTKEVVTPRVEDITVMTPNSNEKLRKEVVNDTNNTLKLTLKKFAYAMFGVVISSIIIFVILILMNKISLFKGLPLFRREDENPVQKSDFTIPNGENDALRVFFEKTR